MNEGKVSLYSIESILLPSNHCYYGYLFTQKKSIYPLNGNYFFLFPANDTIQQLLNVQLTRPMYPDEPANILHL